MQADQYARDQAVGLSTAFRNLTKTLTWTAVFMDVVVVIDVIILLCLHFNSLRMPVYHPTQMQPWAGGSKGWHVFWRIFSVIPFLWIIPVFLLMLVFYPSGAALVVFEFLTFPGLVLGLVSFFWLVIDDWKHCSDRLWCACLTDYVVTAGVPTITYCSSGSGATGVFIAHVWLLLSAVIMVIIMEIFGFIYHAEARSEPTITYNNNANRMLISSNAGVEEGSVPMLGRKKKNARISV